MRIARRREVKFKPYGASEVVFEPEAQKALQHIKALGLERLNVCIAKTQYSFSDDAKALGRARGFNIIRALIKTR